ncbi:MAG: HAD family hydrolase [Muricoprocola sp.]
MDKKYIFFDLDGTLTDPQEGITKSVQHALKSFGIIVEDRSQLNKFIGPPLDWSFETFYGFSHEQAVEAVNRYREHFGVKGKFENEVYEGIPELLGKLREAGKTLIVATSKPTFYSKQILEHFDLAKYFTDIQGSEMNGERTDKAEVIAYAMKQNHIVDPKEIIMVGDREHDMIGACKNGVQAVGVLYGYGTREELEKNGASFIAQSVEELERILL